MAGRLVSYDMLENVLGRQDFEEESTNLGNLKAAKAVLRTALRQELTDRQRECVKLYFYDGLTEDEVGRTLGISKSTVCRHLQKAKQRLEKAVSYAGTARQAMTGGEWH